MGKRLEAKKKEILETKKKEAITKLQDMSPMQVTLAYLFAKYYSELGVDVTEKWTTALQNNLALTKAFSRGYYEALKDSQKEKNHDRSTRD